MTDDPSQPTIQRTVITPDMARKLLANNGHNRPLDGKRVRAIARDMEAGKFQFNGDSICVAEDDTLLDGQHRLAACIQSDQPFETLLVTGLDKTTQRTMDAGKARTLGDVLSIEGNANPILLSGIVRAVYLTEELGLEAWVSVRLQPTNSELEDFLTSHPDLHDLTERAATFSKRTHRMLSPTQYAALWWEFSKIDRQAADRFFSKLATGSDLSEGSPILVLRNALYITQNERKRASRADRLRLLALCVKAWNRWRDGRPCRMLRYSATEPFPQAR